MQSAFIFLAITSANALVAAAAILSVRLVLVLSCAN